MKKNAKKRRGKKSEIRELKKKNILQKRKKKFQKNPPKKNQKKKTLREKNYCLCFELINVVYVVPFDKINYVCAYLIIRCSYDYYCRFSFFLFPKFSIHKVDKYLNVIVLYTKIL
jgi:hypothetical protein